MQCFEGRVLIGYPPFNYREPAFMLAWPTRCVVEASNGQFSDRPNVVCDSKCHGGRDAQSFVDTAKIVMGDIQPDRRCMVVRSLAEPIRQSREAARRHSQGQILALNVAG